MKKSWYSIKALSGNAAALTIFDDIGSFGVTATQFIADLASLGDIQNLTIQINSEGGSVQDGVAIFNAIKQHPAHATIEINGWALSIASFIAMAGDTIRMAGTGLLMMHNPWINAGGDAAELRKTADILDKTREALISGYARSGKSRAAIIALLDAETWFTADEALAAGFVDEVQATGLPIAASFNSSKFTIPQRFTQKGNTAMNMQINNQTHTADEIRAAALAADAQRRTDIKYSFGKFKDVSGVADLQAACENSIQCSAQDANTKLLAHLGKGSSPINGNLPANYFDMQPRPGNDFQEACSQSLLIRAGVRVVNPSPLVKDVERLNLTAMAENILSMNGKRVPVGRAEIIKAALSTSDFPLLLSNTAGKAMTLGYDNEPTTHQVWTGEKEVQNFKPQSFVALSEAPGLLEVLEGAEYIHGAFGEAGETFSIKTYGRILEITRQMLINDDLAAFTTMPAAFGSSARRLEADLVYAKLTSNPNMADGVALFHSGHSNLAASGAALSVTTLGAARAAMRKQKGILATQYVDPQPRFLIVPVALESLAEALLSSLVLYGASNDSSNLSWIKNLTLVADPRLDANSATAWYLAASPSQIDTIVRAYLMGQSRPFYEEELEFGRDVMGVKCRLDVGCGVIDYRGLYKNAGV